LQTFWTVSDTGRTSQSPSPFLIFLFERLPAAHAPVEGPVHDLTRLPAVPRLFANGATLPPTAVASWIGAAFSNSRFFLFFFAPVVKKFKEDVHDNHMKPPSPRPNLMID
jgi:hypothetical protein